MQLSLYAYQREFFSGLRKNGNKEQIIVKYDIIPSLTVEWNKTPRKPSVYAGCEVFWLRFEI